MPIRAISGEGIRRSPDGGTPAAGEFHTELSPYLSPPNEAGATGQRRQPGQNRPPRLADRVDYSPFFSQRGRSTTEIPS